MKKLTRKSLDELAKIYPVLSDEEQRGYVAGTSPTGSVTGVARDCDVGDCTFFHDPNEHNIVPVIITPGGSGSYNGGGGSPSGISPTGNFIDSYYNRVNHGLMSDYTNNSNNSSSTTPTVGGGGGGGAGIWGCNCGFSQCGSNSAAKGWFNGNHIGPGGDPKGKILHAADWIAYQHDRNYEAVGAAGITGCFDPATTPANLLLIDQCAEMLVQSILGKTFYENQPITCDSKKAAVSMIAAFGGIERVKSRYRILTNYFN